MGRQFVRSVCMVCVLCAIHTHCTVHHSGALDSQNLTRAGWLYAERLNPQLDMKHSDDPRTGRHIARREDHDVEAINQDRGPNLVVSVATDEPVIDSAQREGRNVVDINAQRLRLSRDVQQVDRDFDGQFYIRKVFDNFGDGKAMTYDGFERMLKKLKLDELINERLQKDEVLVGKSLAKDTGNSLTQLNSSVSPENTKAWLPGPSRCVKSRSLFALHTNSSDTMDQQALYRACPSLLYRLTTPTHRERQDGCVVTPRLAGLHASSHVGDEVKEEVNQGKVWLYSTLSIIVISLCGLLGVAVIPIMKHVFYQQLLQFFVALAIGTLCGDALLHLLPHAMSSAVEHDDHHDDPTTHSNHDENMYKGLVGALGIIFLFFTEKCLALLSQWRQKHQRKRKVPPRVRVMRDRPADNVGNATVGEKLCKHKYSSYPYCYDEITTEMTEDNHHKNVHHKTSEHQHSHEHNHNELGAATALAAVTAQAAAGNGDCEDECADQELAGLGTDGVAKVAQKDSYTVILREHENTHHGHSHTHGHVHSPPESMSAVAWMVIMGDGLHNFTDGMAIGAAFSSNIPGGFSTAIAVFCHELPHEVGDFAVLLTAGMSPKQAIFYNVLSSVLCFVGMVIGVLAGNWEQATQWIFAAAAGMFLYIALVDMIPELTTGHSKEGGSFCQCLLQMAGLLCGLGIMFTIAVYEDDLRNIFTDRY